MVKNTKLEIKYVVLGNISDILKRHFKVNLPAKN
jgi:hypothetical protein